MNNTIDLRDTFSESFLALARTNKNVMLLDCDMGLHGLKDFEQEFPDQFLQMGAAEANCVNVAAGLAMQGKFPFILSIASFITSRAYEQLKINVGGHNLPVTIVGVGPGMSFGHDGTTHHAISDIGLMRTIPEFEIINPSDPETIQQWVDIPNRPRYLRLDKDIGKRRKGFDDNSITYYLYREEDQNNYDIILYTTGYMTDIALEVQDLLKQNDIIAWVYENIVLNQEGPNFEPNIMFSLEEHDIETGLGAIYNISMDHRFGFPHAQITEFGTREYFLEKYELTAEKIAKKILQEAH